MTGVYGPVDGHVHVVVDGVDRCAQAFLVGYLGVVFAVMFVTALVVDAVMYRLLERSRR